LDKLDRFTTKKAIAFHLENGFVQNSFGGYDSTGVRVLDLRRRRQVERRSKGRRLLERRRGRKSGDNLVKRFFFATVTDVYMETRKVVCLLRNLSIFRKL
jgi:hypothetical protein